MSDQSNRRFEGKVPGESLPGRSTPEKKLRLGVLISGAGSNLQTLIDAIEGGELPGVEIALVVSNNASAYGIQRALAHKVPVIYLPWRKYPAGAFLNEMTPNEGQLAGLLQFFRADLVVLAGWMRILSASFLDQFPRRVINIHPALLPEAGTGATYTLSTGETIPALRGMHVVKMALDAGLTITGSSIHYVSAEVDAGPVICQREVPIKANDTEETLHERLKETEHVLLVEAIRQFSQRG